MKEDNNHQADQVVAWVCPSKIYLYLCIVLLFLSVGETKAQCPHWNNVFYHGERMDYDVYFKWGLIMSKAGVATFSVTDDEYKNNPAWKYNLLFQTNGVFEKVYRMRDTITTYYSPKLKLLYSTKNTNEGGYYLVEELTFSYSGNKTKAHSYRHTAKETKIDTTLTSSGCLFDMMAACMHLRSIDTEGVKKGDKFNFNIAVGRDIVHASYRYNKKETIEINKKKYDTHHFYIDIYDEVFTQKKEAAEVWVGDDENRIPVKVRAKLKIGAAEVYLKDTYNLQHPMTSRTNK